MGEEDQYCVWSIPPRMSIKYLPLRRIHYIERMGSQLIDEG
jgi:hypothetical protein